MLVHLASPWILARLIIGISAAVLSTVASIGAVRILVGYRSSGAPDERTLHLERQSDLVSTALTLAFTLEIFATVITVLASDRLANSIRGAMCAYGVLGSTPWGSTALRGSLFAACGCAAWLATRRVDVRLQRGSLVRSLAGLALIVTTLIYADLVASTAYFFSLDMDVVATCCSVFVDASGGGRGGFGDSHGRFWELGIAASVVIVSVGSGVALWRRPSGVRALLMGVLGIVGGYFALRATTDVVAPYVYESPAHRCPYCLLHTDAAPAGPILLFAIATAFLLSVGAISIVPHLRRPAAVGAVRDVLRRLGQWSAIAWTTAALCAAYPIIRFWLNTGTIQLFR